MVGEIARHRQLATVEGRVAEAVHAVFGDELQRHEISARAADDDLSVDDFHDPRSDSGLGSWDLTDLLVSSPDSRVPNPVSRVPYPASTCATRCRGSIAIAAAPSTEATTSVVNPIS